MSAESFPADLSDRYLANRRLGVGGMGEVFLAREVALDRLVAVKFLLSSEGLREAPEAVRIRFLEEARVMAQVSHPHVIRVFDTGTCSVGPYIVMEYVEGEALHEVKRSVEMLPVFLALAGGLDAVHAAGILHRDIKPPNILLRADDQPVLLDFGLARSEDRATMTKTGAILGTSGFLAPELFQGAAPSPASDWFAWGVSLFVMLEGRFPYGTAAVLQLAQGRPAPVAPFVKTPPGHPVRRVLAAALSPDPSLRPKNTDAVRRILEAGAGARSDRLPSFPTQVLDQATIAHLVHQEPVRETPSVGLSFAGRGIFLAGVWVFVLFVSAEFFSRPPPPPAAAGPPEVIQIEAKAQTRRELRVAIATAEAAAQGYLALQVHPYAPPNDTVFLGASALPPAPSGQVTEWLRAHERVRQTSGELLAALARAASLGHLEGTAPAMEASEGLSKALKQALFIMTKTIRQVEEGDRGGTLVLRFGEGQIVGKDLQAFRDLQGNSLASADAVAACVVALQPRVRVSPVVCELYAILVGQTVRPQDRVGVARLRVLRETLDGGEWPSSPSDARWRRALLLAEFECLRAELRFLGGFGSGRSTVSERLRQLGPASPEILGPAGAIRWVTSILRYTYLPMHSDKNAYLAASRRWALDVLSGPDFAAYPTVVARHMQPLCEAGAPSRSGGEFLARLCQRIEGSRE